MPTAQEQLFDTARTWAARLGLTDAFEAIGGDRSAWDARRRQRIGAAVAFGLVGAGLLPVGRRGSASSA